MKRITTGEANLPGAVRSDVSPQPLDADRFESFAADFHGDVIRPGDADYDDARAVWNGMIDRHPAVIARCRGVADVQAALAFAREEALPVSVRGGGHDVAGTAVVDDGLVVDCSPMRAVRVDPAESAFAGRGAPFLLGVEANWEDPADDGANVEWVRDCVADVRQFSDGSFYLNFPGFFEGGEATMETTFGPAYERLLSLKDEYDPNGLFRRNEAVRAADGDGESAGSAG